MRFGLSSLLARRLIFIHSEATPNPQSRRFVPENNGEQLFFFNSKPNAAFEWKRVSSDDIELIYNSTEFSLPPPRLVSLAGELMRKNEPISRIFIGSNFLTATKHSMSSVEWTQLSPQITFALDSFFSNQKELEAKDLQHEKAQTANAHDKEAPSEDDEITQMIKELLDTKIRPYVQSDGGDIAFVSYSSGIVKVKLHGACSTCASSSETLKRGVGAMIKYYIPEVIDVIDVTMDSAEEDAESLQAFEALEQELQKRR